MDSFLNLVETARSKKQDRQIKNASISHARVLVRDLLRSAIENGEDVRIVSGCLEADFYVDLCELAQKVFDSGHTISIILEDIDMARVNNGFFDLVDQNENGRIWEVNVNKLDYFYHFTLVSNCRYRLETNHEAKEAVANFNDTGLGQRLHDRFTNLLKISRRVDANTGVKATINEVAFAQA